MPFVVRSDSENENEAELVFLSPEEDPPKEGRTQPQDQGASPVLRRSNRKRKSTTSYSDMSKNSSSKKKKGSSPDPGRSMPKIPRTPQAEQEDKERDQEGSGRAFEAMLLATEERLGTKMEKAATAAQEAMEARLGAKMEKAAEAAQEAVRLSKLTKDNLDALDVKVDKNEGTMREAIRTAEERIMTRVDDRVKFMVDSQLRTAGFDPELSSGDLEVRETLGKSTGTASYASMASQPSTSGGPSFAARRTAVERTMGDRQQEKFWHARRSLRLWPIPSGDRKSLDDYLKTKLRLDQTFIDEELGEVTIRKVRDPRRRNRDEHIVTFETKQIRDAVKAAASNLANFDDAVGMRLHLPDHLQKDFHALMNLSFDLKKRNPGLKRNVKFDEEDCGLFMDFRLEDKADWKRVKPAQAAAATKRRNKKGTQDLDAEELKSLLSGEESE